MAVATLRGMCSSVFIEDISLLDKSYSTVSKLSSGHVGSRERSEFIICTYNSELYARMGSIVNTINRIERSTYAAQGLLAS